MQIGTTSSFLNTSSQPLTPVPGVGGVKTNSPLKNANSETQQAADEASQAPATASQASGGNGKRGGLINIVV